MPSNPFVPNIGIARKSALDQHSRRCINDAPHHGPAAVKKALSNRVQTNEILPRTAHPYRTYWHVELKFPCASCAPDSEEAAIAQLWHCLCITKALKQFTQTNEAENQTVTPSVPTLGPVQVEAAGLSARKTTLTVSSSEYPDLLKKSGRISATGTRRPLAGMPQGTVDRSQEVEVSTVVNASQYLAYMP